MSDRNDLLQKLAAYYEARAASLTEMVRRYGNMVTPASESWKAQAMAFKEAAAYAHQQKEEA